MAPGNEAELLDMLTISNKKTVQELRKKNNDTYSFSIHVTSKWKSNGQRQMAAK